MTEGSGLYLAGPALVKAAIGQVVEHEDLGGAEMHAQISGTIDFREKDDTACLDRLKLADRDAAGVGPHRRCGRPGARRVCDAGLNGVHRRYAHEYGIRDLLPFILDAEPFDEPVQSRIPARP